MKFLAILKDSLREALDSKVFYVTVALSLVLVLVVASLSFQPVSAEEALKQIVDQFRIVFPNRGRSVLQPHMSWTTYQVADLELLNEPSTPDRGDYRFTLSVKEKDCLEAVGFWNEGATESATIDAALLEEFIASQFATFGSLDVAKVKKSPTAPAGMLKFTIETRGSTGIRGWPHDPCLFFGAVPMRFFRQPLGFIVYWIEDRLVTGFGAWIGILAGVIITSFFIPNMLRKGTVDMLLVKPIHRATLLLYKFLGGLTFVFLNSAIAIVGIWLAIGLRSGIWAPGFLLTILIITYFFAILYSVSTLCGVLSRSAIVSIVVTCLAWFLMWLIGVAHQSLTAIKKDSYFQRQFTIPEWVYQTVESLHFFTPRSNDLDVLTTQLLSHDIMTEADRRRARLDLLPELKWGESLTVSGVFVAIMLSLGCLRFAFKDY